MDMTVLSALAGAFAITMYVLLDGFDLGVGLLLLFARGEGERDLMVESVAPVWDGNETWLILGGVALLGAFPVAYGVLLPAFYVPVLLMLMALGFRGIAFEFRFQTMRWRRLWDLSFCLGSAAAVFCQGLIVGGLIGGVSVEGGQFSGGTLDFFSPLSLLVAAALLAGYGVLGAGWLAWRSEGALLELSMALLRGLLLAWPALSAVCLAVAAWQQPRIPAAWAARPLAFVLLALGLAAAYATCWRGVRAGRGRQAFFAAVACFAALLLGLGFLLWPFVVPFALTIHDAASPRGSQVFLMTGMLLLLPVILGYTGFAYWVFRGKTRALEAGE